MKRTVRPGENPGQIEADFDTLRAAFNSKWRARTAAQTDVSNDYRLEQRCFNLAELNPQSFTTGCALRPDPQAPGNKKRSAADHEQHGDKDCGQSN
jgi:hypothetical protein